MCKRTSIDFIYRDQDIFVINKPPALHSVSIATNAHSLASELVKLTPELAEIHAQVGEAGLVQRLDYSTSGCILGACNVAAHSKLKDFIKQQLIKKTYIALVEQPPSCLEINASIGSPYRRAKKVRVYSPDKVRRRALPARTKVEILKASKNGCWVRCFTTTGRRHQIRAHLAHIGSPLVGDTLYGAKGSLAEIIGDNKTQADFILHAESLEFAHPVTGKQLKILAPLTIAGLESGD